MDYPVDPVCLRRIGNYLRILSELDTELSKYVISILFRSRYVSNEFVIVSQRIAHQINSCAVHLCFGEQDVAPV